MEKFWLNFTTDCDMEERILVIVPAGTVSRVEGINVFIGETCFVFEDYQRPYISRNGE